MAKAPTNNAKSASPSGSVSADAIPLHKKLAMGQNPETGSGSGKKTPA